MTIPSTEQADVAGTTTRDDLVAWDQEFQDVCARLDGLFYRTDSRTHARHYLRGLLAPLERTDRVCNGGTEKHRHRHRQHLHRRPAHVGQEYRHSDEIHDWSRRSCGIGTKGFRVYDWALVDAGEGHHFVFRRNIADGELAYFHCYNPRGEPMTELVRVIGTRWPIEECFQAAKNEAGLDNYQVRLYHAWYRHVTLAMLALAFLAVIRHTAKKGAHRPGMADPSRPHARRRDSPHRYRTRHAGPGV